MADNPQMPPAPATSGEFKRKTAPTPPVAIPPLPVGVQKPALSPDAVREMKKETLRISLPPKPLAGGVAAPGAARAPMMAPTKQTLQPTKVIPAPAQLNVTRPIGIPAVMSRPPQLGGAAVPPPPVARPVPPAPLQATAPVPSAPKLTPTGVVPPANISLDTQATQPLAKVTMPAARPMTTSPIPAAKAPSAPIPAPASIPAPVSAVPGVPPAPSIAAPGMIKPPGAPVAPPVGLAKPGLPPGAPIKPPGVPVAVPAPAPVGVAKPILPPGAPSAPGAPKLPAPPAPGIAGLPKPPGAPGMPAPSAAPLPKAPAPILAGAAVPVAGAKIDNDASKTAVIKGTPGTGHKPAGLGAPMPAKAPGAPGAMPAAPVAPGAKLPVPAAAPKPVGAPAGPIKPGAPAPAPGAPIKAGAPAAGKTVVSQQPINVVGDSVSTYLAVAACIVALLSVAVTAASYFEVM